MGCAWLFLLEPPTVAHYPAGVALTGLAVVLELLGEPAWVLSQARWETRRRVMSELAAAVVRTALTGVLVVWYGASLGVLAFAIAQVAYSAVWAGALTWSVGRACAEGVRGLAPTALRRGSVGGGGGDGGGGGLNARALALSGAFLRQSVVKQVLTEGERFVLTALVAVPFSEQGTFDVVNNLGALAARFLFQPVEESFYVFFGGIVGRREGGTGGGGDGVGGGGRDSRAARPRASDLARASRVLGGLLKGLALVGLAVAVFGQSHAWLALRLYGGERLASSLGVGLLRLYCGYVLLLAVNGITECFVFATADRAYLDRYNSALVAFTGAFLGVALVLVPRVGTPGLLAANCVNMGLRIAHNLWFVRRFFASAAAAAGPSAAATAAATPAPAAPPDPLRLALPSAWSLAALAAGGALAQWSEWRQLGPAPGLGWAAARHLALGVSCFALYVAVCAVAERDTWRWLWRLRRSGKAE